MIGASASHTKSARSVPITPEKVMDAPTLKDDYCKLQDFFMLIRAYSH